MDSFLDHSFYGRPIPNYYSTPPHYPPCHYPPYQPPAVNDIYYHTPPAPFPRDHSWYQPTKKTTIPVNFLGSGQKKPTLPDYAVIIQKAFRGYLIRKNVNKILELKRQVDDVERVYILGEKVDLIKFDCKERLKVNEMLMTLLLKLDSINGVNDVVRVFRKSVIGKAIILQEKIDSLANSQTLEAKIEDSNTMQVELESDKSNEVDSWENVEFVDAENREELAKNEWCVLEESKLLEKMAEDNKKLMEMVADLCKKNEAQTTLISSLSRRVEQLEQAASDRLKRKKENKKKKMSVYSQYFQ